MAREDVEMWYVEYSDDLVFPEESYTTKSECEAHVDALPYEQQMSATLQYYDPFED